MWLFSRTRRSAQDALHCQRDIKHLSPIGSLTACALAAIAASALVFSAAAQNVSYSYSLGQATSEKAAYMLAAASLGASILGPCAWLAVFGRGVGLGRRAVALVLAVGCLAYASTCSLGYQHGARVGAVSGHQTAADEYSDVRALKRAAIAELGTLKGQSPDVLKRRRELTAIIAAPSATKAVQPSAGDGTAAALAFYIRAAGHQVSDAAVGTWLSLGSVGFLELAAALSFTVVAALRPLRPQKPQIQSVAVVSQQAAHVAPTPEMPATAEKIRESGDDKDDAPPPAAPKGRGKGGRPSAVSPETAVARLRKAGGQATGSIARVGKLMGVRSKSTAHRLLNRLSSDGHVRYSASPQGVSVALV